MAETAVIARREVRRPPLRGPFGRKAIRIGRVLDIEIGLDVSWLFIFALVMEQLLRVIRAQMELDSRR